MKIFKLDTSLKNIPVSSQIEFKERLVEQVGKLMRRMRLKVYFSGGKNKKDEMNDTGKETYGFKSRFTPAATNQQLKTFENDLMELVKSVEFRRIKNNFQAELQNDVSRIKGSRNVIVAADKTTNFYEMSKDEYLKLLADNITAGYQKADEKVVININEEARMVTKNLEISDRINKLPLKESFITLKDHKENFQSAPKCRLINPTKSNVGRISKVILDRINNKIRKETGLKQWTDTDQVLKWFLNLDAAKFKLLKFDVVEFYPSITEELLNKALKFAEKHVKITAEEINIIKNSCESVLHSRGDIWVKKKKSGGTGSLFDIAMGSYNGAETCELIGLYMLHGLNKIFGPGLVGLYRDDGLAAIPIQSGYKTEKLKASIHRFAKGFGLKVTIEAPLTSTDFLDVQLNIDSKSFAPYRKPNSRILYVNAGSNHPSNIINSIPNIINDRLNKRSSSEKAFNESKNDYERALKEAGYKNKLTYKKENTKKEKKNRKRKIMWFNPPYCASVKTNIARKFINLVNRHFSKKSPLKCLFNKNNMRVSYCCMDNIDTIIKKHNARILNEGNQSVDQGCNCNNKEECPFKNEKVSCRATGIVYKAEVKSESEHTYYIGLSEGEFKTRFNNHNSSFNLDRDIKKPTALANHVRGLKRDGKDYSIEWSVMRRARPIKDGDAVCRLCIREATAIAFADQIKSNQIQFVVKDNRAQ